MVLGFSRRRSDVDGDGTPSAAVSQYEPSLPPYDDDEPDLPPSFAPGEPHEYIYRPAPHDTDGLAVMDGGIVKYVVDSKPPKSSGAAVTIHEGESFDAPIVAAVVQKSGGKDPKLCLGDPSSASASWHEVAMNTTHTKRTFIVPSSGRTFNLKVSQDSKLGCSTLSTCDQKLVDAKTGDVQAVFILNVNRESFKSDRKRATFRWRGPMSKDEELAAIALTMAWRVKNQSGGLLRGIGLASADGGGWASYTAIT